MGFDTAAFDPSEDAQSGDTAEPQRAAPQPWPDRRTANYSLFVLSVVVMFTVLDRQILALMIEPIKADFRISDTQAALLLGAAFSLTYGIAGLPIARIADQSNRRNLVAASIAFWSACTMACGIAQNYAMLFLARLGIGIGESGYGPATWSIVADSFPRERVASAVGMLAVGAQVGTGLALVIGGGALAFVEQFPPMHIPLIGIMRPWQWAFVIVGLPGLLWAMLVLTTHEPARRGIARKAKSKTVPVSEVWRYLKTHGRTYAALIGGNCIQLLVANGSAQWYPTLYHREFGWTLPEIGLLQGTVIACVSPVGLILGGKISERWIRRGVPDANLRIMFYAQMVLIPMAVITPLLPSPWLMLAASGVNFFATAVAMGPNISGVQLVTPNVMRAQISSLIQFSSNVIAFALGPLCIAIFTDYLFHDPLLLKYSMSLFAAIMGPIAILLVFQGLKPYARTYEAAVRDFAH